MSTYRGELLAAYGQIGALLNYSDITDDFTRESAIRNQRAHFHHEVSRWIVNRYGLIAIEDLNVKGLAAGMLAKSVRDAGWSSFFSMLSYKAEYAGRELVKVDPRGTSQTCVCGTRVPKGLSDRWHKCPACGLSAVVLECRQIRTS